MRTPNKKPADELKEIAYQMHHGILSHKEAHALAAPIIEKMNERSKQLAKEYGVAYKAITFTHFTR